MNNCTLIGKVYANPTTQITPNGNKLCFLFLETERVFQKDVHDRFRIRVPKLAVDEVMEKVKTGDLISVYGRLSGTVFDKLDGTSAYYVEVLAERITFLNEL